MNSYKCIVKGRVQGVYYRKNVHENATKANFGGYVKNLADGTVEACVTCEEERFNEFMGILQKGSPQSRVDSVDVSMIEEKFTEFRILE